jgi:hypothetical protein
MSRSKSLSPFKVRLADGAEVIVLGRSKKGAISYAEQVAGLQVDHKHAPEIQGEAAAAEAINRQEERV